MAMLTIGSTILALLSFAGVNANLHGPHETIAGRDYPSLPAQYFELPIDHFNSNAGTFKNRWWFNDTYYDVGGPVIIYDAGEWNAEFDTYLLQGIVEPWSKVSPRNAVMQLAQQYHGIAVLWEHRYFGQSVPFAQDNGALNRSTFNADQWSYHTFEQALEDVVFFANKFALPSDAVAISKLKTSDGLHASKTPFIFLGAAYAGTRAAALRIRNPETIFASWASSAPVQHIPFSPFYYRAMTRGLPRNCSSDMSSGVKYFDSVMSQGNATLKSRVKNDLYNIAMESNVDVSTTDALEDGIVAQQIIQPFDFYDGSGPQVVQPFCDILESQGNKTTPSPGGIATHVSASDVWDAILLGIKTVHFGPTLTSSLAKSHFYPRLQRSIRASSDESPLSDDDILATTWLRCSELGDYPTADENANINILSTTITAATYWSQCNTSFPNMIPASWQVDVANVQYGGWNQNSPRVMYTHGELDPSIVFSVASSEDGSPKRKPTGAIPPADGTPDNGSYYGIVHANLPGASDLMSLAGAFISLAAARSEAFETSLSMFKAALDEWLPSFKPGNDPMLTTPTGTVTGTAAIPEGTGGGESKGNGAVHSRTGNHGTILFVIFSGLGWSLL